MRSGSNWRLLLPRQLRHLPADLAAILTSVFLTSLAVFLPGLNETPVRVVVGLPFVLFVPGYAFIAALFPEKPSGEADSDSPSTHSGIDGIERVALSFGTSIAIVPLVGLILNFTPWGIRLVPIVISVSGITLVFTAIAANRRWTLPKSERFTVPYQTWLANAQNELFNPDTRTDAALNILLVISVILAVTSVGYAIAVPKQGESFTEFYLLTENKQGELVADNYPTEFTRGEDRTLTVGIGNQEHHPVNYTVVVELQRVSIHNNSTTVQRTDELRRFQTYLKQNESWHLQHTVTPTITGTNLRLTYLLYRGSVPPDPTVGNSYRELHLWVNVTASDE